MMTTMPNIIGKKKKNPLLEKKKFNNFELKKGKIKPNNLPPMLGVYRKVK